MKVKALFLCIMMSGILAGCKVSQNDKETIVKVNPEFTIDLFEQLGQPRAFQFKIATIEKQVCTNYSISTYSTLSFNRVTLSVDDLLPPVDCIEGEGPARAVANVGTLPNGYFNLSINLKDAIRNDGLLKVYQDSIVVDLDSKDGLELVHEVLLRIPETALWGYAAYNDKAAGEEPAKAFLADLADKATATQSPQGYYGYFKVDGSGDVILLPPPSHTYFQTFFYNYEGDIADIKVLLQNYRTANSSDQVEFVVFTGRGESL
ncbi:MAG: hypothetical protein ACE5FF_02295 [Saprospiraceae bacterium]